MAIQRSSGACRAGRISLFDPLPRVPRDLVAAEAVCPRLVAGQGGDRAAHVAEQDGRVLDTAEGLQGSRRVGDPACAGRGAADRLRGRDEVADGRLEGEEIEDGRPGVGGWDVAPADEGPDEGVEAVVGPELGLAGVGPQLGTQGDQYGSASRRRPGLGPGSRPARRPACRSGRRAAARPTSRGRAPPRPRRSRRPGSARPRRGAAGAGGRRSCGWCRRRRCRGRPGPRAGAPRARAGRPGSARASSSRSRMRSRSSPAALRVKVMAAMRRIGHRRRAGAWAPPSRRGDRPGSWSCRCPRRRR